MALHICIYALEDGFGSRYGKVLDAPMHGQLPVAAEQQCIRRSQCSRIQTHFHTLLQHRGLLTRQGPSSDAVDVRAFDRCT